MYTYTLLELQNIDFINEVKNSTFSHSIIQT